MIVLVVPPFFEQSATQILAVTKSNESFYVLTSVRSRISFKPSRVEEGHSTVRKQKKLASERGFKLVFSMNNNFRESVISIQIRKVRVFSESLKCLSINGNG
jgi:hypothetical protein